jgi:hypothetical protein
MYNRAPQVIERLPRARRSCGLCTAYIHVPHVIKHLLRARRNRACRGNRTEWLNGTAPCAKSSVCAVSVRHPGWLASTMLKVYVSTLPSMRKCGQSAALAHGGGTVLPQARDVRTRLCVTLLRVRIAVPFL